MKPCLVYVAGPFRARSPWEVERNVRAAETATLALASMGAVPVCATSIRLRGSLLSTGSRGR